MIDNEKEFANYDFERHVSGMLDSILAELKKLNQKEEVEDFVFKMFGDELTIRFSDVIDKEPSKNMLVVATNKDTYIFNDTEKDRFLLWFDAQKRKVGVK